MVGIFRRCGCFFPYFRIFYTISSPHRPVFVVLHEKPASPDLETSYHVIPPVLRTAARPLPQVSLLKASISPSFLVFSFSSLCSSHVNAFSATRSSLTVVSVVAVRGTYYSPAVPKPINLGSVGVTQAPRSSLPATLLLSQRSNFSVSGCFYYH